MHPDQRVFSINIPVNDPEKMDAFQKVMDDYQDSMINYVNSLAKELNTPTEVAWNIYYLRSRSRWSQELENRILTAARAGHVINTGTGEEEGHLRKLIQNPLTGF